MKRLMLRLSGLATVIVLGLMAMAWAQRGSDKGEDSGEPAKLPAEVTRAARAKPIPLNAVDEDYASGDAFHDDASHAQRAAASDDAANPAAADEPSDAAPADAPRRRDPFGLATRAAEPKSGFDEHAADTDAARTDSTADATAGDSNSASNAAAAETTDETPSSTPPRRLTDATATEPETSLDGQPADRTAEEPARRETSSNESEPTKDTSASDTSASEEERPVRSTPQLDTAPSGAEGSGRPGHELLEGPQIPSLTIEKTAPDEIQVGKPATFTIKVRNTGSVVAQGVEVLDQVPKGTQFVAATPKANLSPEGQLVWDLGAIKPGDENTLQVQLMPVSEGEIGSTATVRFRAEATVRTLATRPGLEIKASAPQSVMIGQPLELKIVISNPGSGAASGVIVSELVPNGLKHPAGSELEFEIGVLKPGETRELALTLTAATAGPVKNLLRVRGDANLSAEIETELEVIAPDLKVSLTGPKRRYLERAAVYNISVSNPGTAPARDIELVTVLPRGLKFVEANNAGQYDSATHSVYWSLEELPARESGSVTLKALPIEPGDLTLKIKGQARQGLVDQAEETIVVEGLSAVQFELSDAQDPVEVGGETTYEVRVTNQGSKAASNVRVAALLPADMKLVSADGPVRHSADGQKVVFEALSQLAPKADTTFTIKVKTEKAGDQRIRVQVMSDDLKTPITKEESTRVYADE